MEGLLALCFFHLKRKVIFSGPTKFICNFKVSKDCVHTEPFLETYFLSIYRPQTPFQWEGGYEEKPSYNGQTRSSEVYLVISRTHLREVPRLRGVVMFNPQITYTLFYPLTRIVSPNISHDLFESFDFEQNIGIFLYKALMQFFPSPGLFFSKKWCFLLDIRGNRAIANYFSKPRFTITSEKQKPVVVTSNQNKSPVSPGLLPLRVSYD